MPLTHFRFPAAPADHLLRRVLTRVRRLLGRDKEPFVASTELDETSFAAREDLMAPPPACEPMLQLLDAMLNDWIAASSPEEKVKLVVMPPGDNQVVIRHWAEGRGLDCLDPPADRSVLLDADWQLPDLSGDGVLVIAMLECWYLRHAETVNCLQQLLIRIAETDRPILVACNMWAWRCFESTLDARSLLPAPLTFPAFDAHALRRWLLDLSQADGTSEASFREASTGIEVLALGEEGDFATSWLPGLAAQSLGIPWIAWTLWKHAMRTRPDDVEVQGEDTTVDDESTIWLAPLAESALSDRLGKPALLLLHSVLLHGSLGRDELVLTLPGIDVLPLLHALQRAGVVELDDKRHVVTAHRYPDVHTALDGAGMQMIAG